MSPVIEQAFHDRRLIRPDPSQPDLVYLVRALATLCGVEGFGDSPVTQQLMNEIGAADHYIFILLDGMGMNLVRKLPADSFIRRHLRTQIRATSPSTTACALTSVATGEWPARHGVCGWFTYLPDHNLSITTLPFVERFSGEWLTNRGLSPQQVLPVPAFYPRMTSHQPMTFLPTPIVNTTYARYSRGDTPAMPYDSIHYAIDQLVARIASAATLGRTYTHLYIPDVDTRCHHHGTQDTSVWELMLQIDSELSRLAEQLTGRARIIISADHGLIDVPVANHMSLPSTDPLMKMLRVPPSGDARLPVFHVCDGHHEDFAGSFNERFGKSMALLKTEEADAMQLFGPGSMSDIARRRFGDFVGIAFRNFTLHYFIPAPPGAAPRAPYLAQHAGLSPDEMEIPLIIA